MMEMNEEQKNAIEVLLRATAPDREKEMKLSMQVILNKIDILVVMLGKMNQRQMDQDRTIKELEFEVRHRSDNTNKVIDKYEEVLQKLKYQEFIFQFTPHENKNAIKEERLQEILATKISHIFCRRTSNALQRGLGIKYIRDLITKTRSEIWHTVGIGKYAMSDIHNFMEINNLHWEMKL